jgi:hypothetical protein
LQQKGQDKLPCPLFVPAKCCSLQEFSKWAMLDLNQRPLLVREAKGVAEYSLGLQNPHN